ncbi:lipopolysaccharide biosynthesis protein [Pedobacter frigoris]|uniref:lipopolysaccharide biosynthesis protein n=1 Tax=Pedobacter frigoris TaxID=2571272 RepID=UPI00292CEE5B|nr:lipopolysaccharide biosynthesis protein [Pedobacter frigoris]
MKKEDLVGSNQDREEITLRELVSRIKIWWRYILSKWLIIFFSAFVGMLFGVAYAFLNKTIYVAETTFVLEDDQGKSVGSLAGLASIAGFDLGGGGGGIFQGDNILELYKSRTMIEKTLLTEVDLNGKRRTLIDHYISFNKLREDWDNTPDLNKINFNLSRSNSNNASLKRVQDSIIGSIVKDINKSNLTVAKPDKKLNIIKVEVKAYDEFFAKAFNQEIVKNVNDFYVQTKTKKSIQNVAILQRKADSVRNVMDGAIYRAVAVTDATPNLNPTRQIQRVAPAQRSQFSAETNKAILEELVKNLELAKISLLKETPLIQVIDEPILPLFKSKLSIVKSAIFSAVLFLFMCILILVLIKIVED